MSKTPVSYSFKQGQKSIWAEVYFPKRLETQGTIYTALEEGLNVSEVRKYLVENVAKLQDEMAIYPFWFDPDWKELSIRDSNLITKEMAEKRMMQCSRVFFGWSAYEVDGVFGASDPNDPEINLRVDSERIQVFRLIFKFSESEFEKDAVEKKMIEIYRAIVSWVLSEYGQVNSYDMWSNDECERFLRRSN